MMTSRLLVLPFLCIGNFLFAQVIADFETAGSTPVLTPAGVSVVNNPDASGNASTKVAYFQKPAGNWQAIYLDFATEKNTGNNDRLSLKLRSSTQGRVFVKVVNNGATILENWAPDYNTKPNPNTWTECLLDISSIKNQPYDRIEVNASVDNEAVANVYLDDIKLVNTQSLNGEPIISFTVSDYQITKGESIQFDASASYDADGTIVSYTWNFGIAGSETGVLAEHPFTNEGIFPAVLTVQDNEGKTASQRFTINVLPSSGKLGVLQITTLQPQVYKKTEAIFLVNGNYSNVYNPDVIKIDATITQPGGANRTVPCFFFQDASYTPDQWTRNENSGYWMLRFSPTQAGEHNIQLTLTDSKGSVSSVQYFFTVQTSASPGFIKPDSDNKQYFRHETGEPFYPLGINVAWDNTTYYTTIINNLGAGGANVVRYWQVPFDRQGLEWKNGSGFYKGLGVYSQEAAAEQDSIMFLCEANNIFLQLTIFQHGMFSENVNSNWGDNPYKSTNGGPLTSAEQFFYNAQAKAQTKKLLRYIVARWGYSTHLFAWELFNEVNFTRVHPNQSAQWYPGVKSWHDEMGQYIKSLDAFDHPVTSSTDESQLADFDLLTGLDNVQYHLYNPSLLATQETKDKSILAQMTRVGLVNGEYGLDVSTADVPFDAQRVSIWTGIMSQVPHFMWKWDNYTNPDWANLFQHPATFLADEDFVAEGELSDLVMTATYNAEMLEAVGFKTEENFYGVVYDKIYRSNINDGVVNLTGINSGNYTITFTDILTGSETEVTTDVHSELELPTFSKGIAFKGKFNSDIILSAEDTHVNKHFTVFPNPSSGMVYLDVKPESITKVELISALGKISATLVPKDFGGDANKAGVDLNKAGISPGLYFIRVTTAGGSYQGKVVYAPIR